MPTTAVKKRDETLTQLCADRARIYRLLACLYDKEVDAQTAGAIKDLRFNVADMPDEAGKKMAEGANAIARSLFPFDEGVETRLACDYARTFLAAGVSDGAIAVPFESVHTSEEGLMMQEARDEVRAIFRAYGIMPDSGGDIPEDYLPYEFEYMALLSKDSATCLEENDLKGALLSLARQQKFLSSHLLNWFAGFSSIARSIARTQFYQGLLTLTEGFLAFEKDTIAAMEHDLKASASS